MPKKLGFNKILKNILDNINQPLHIFKKYSSSIFSSNFATIFSNDSIDKKSLKEEREYIISDYLIKRTLGRGNFGKVKLGISLKDKEKFAIKILQKNKILEIKDEIRVKREFEMLSKFNHLNVILVSEIFESDENYYTVMEYCEGGELFDYIVKNRYLSENESAFYYFQLISGLEYIHSLGIVHRDLKPENLLLKENHILKIIDFGLSNYFDANQPNNLLTTPCGSPCYASPEMVLGKKYNGFKIDIWATGIILYAMLCGYLPFEESDNQKLFKKISECKFNIPFYIRKDAKDLIKKILVKDPNKRISIAEIKKHPFFLKGKNLFEKVYNLDNNNSLYSSTSLKSKNEQDYKVTFSDINISNIPESKNTSTEKIMKDNLKGLNDNLFSLSKEKSSKSLSSIKKLENNEEKKIGNDNDKRGNDINKKKELKRQKNEYNIFDIKKNKIKTKRKINLNNINNTNNKNNLVTKNCKVYRTHNSSINKKRNKEYESIFKNNLKNKNIKKINNKTRNRNKIDLIKQISQDKSRNIRGHKKNVETNYNINIKIKNNRSIIINSKNNNFIRKHYPNIKSANKKCINPIEEYLKKINNPIKKYNTYFINSKINKTINVNMIKNQRKKGNILINNKIKKNFGNDNIKRYHKMSNIINSEDKNTKKESNKYLKINTKLVKKRLRIRNSNLFNNNKIDSSSNYSTLENFTSTNNSIIKAKKSSSKKYNLTKKNSIKINGYTEVIPCRFFNTRNILNKMNNKGSLNNSSLKNNSLMNNSLRKTETFNTIQKHFISKTSFNLKKAVKSININDKFRIKKNSFTIKNTVINLNMVNSNLIISPQNKKQNKINNNSITIKTSMKQDPKKISKNKVKEPSYKMNDKSKFSNLKSKNKFHRNNDKKDVFNYSHNWAKTEGNDFIINKTKNSLEKAIDKIKQNLLNNKTHIKFNNVRIDGINKNIKILKKNKISIIDKNTTKKSAFNSNYSGNKTFSSKFKKDKNPIKKEEFNSGKLISFPKKNRLLLTKNV